MSASRAPGGGGHGLVMHLSVPVHGSLRAIAGELAARVAEHLGAADAEALGERVDGLAAALGADGCMEERVITFEIRQQGTELVVEGRCDGRASEVRHRLGA